ncbi:ATP-dependent DNA helicase PIF1-like [Leptopilina heterotoma]|uniref:ATP-dependent DNA helicase PIF1-like n=1 Tax=Leptopilina heterotoma TaxID=63436 RepID=UPI001CAA3DD8|nr:ATP-dependent DNA helicase PIF1-like [Leptopilina heterotoma]
MAPKYALEAMELMLRDMTKCKKPFGGKVILLSGDFRQTLPIVPHGNRTHIVEVCVKNSRLWNHFQTKSLHSNVRLDNNQIEFSNWLLNVGDGKPQSTFERENDVLQIPQDMISNKNLIDEVYGSSISRNDSSVFSSCILSLTNSEVLDMNERILLKLEGKEVVYYSNDSHVDDDDPKDINNIVLIEFLNSLTPDGLPPYKLSLKEGCIIMLLRNMNLVQGLCNGTRLVVKSLLTNVISAEIITGKYKGEIVFIPRIDLSPSQDVLPFKIVRRQFPVRLAYAMTMNKSQGQSFDKVGIYLPISAFGHGQVYVAGSRVKSKKI